MLKRMIAILLCLTMLLSLLPAQAVALETEEPAELLETQPVADATEPEAEEPEPTEDETELPEEVTEPVEEETEPVEEELSPTEETVAPIEEVTESVEEEPVPTEETVAPVEGPEPAEELQELEQEPMLADASVVANGTCGENLTWTLDEEGTLTISGTGEMYDYVDLPWRADGSELRDNIKSIVLAEGVTDISEMAFENFSNLQTITIPDTVVSIGSRAFDECINLTEVSIPNGVTEIAKGTFSSCEKLIDVFIPDSVTSIADYAFGWCNSLASISIPASVTEIGHGVFYYCPNLHQITVANDNTAYSSADGVLFNKDKTTLIAYPGGKSGSYIIPQSVTTVEEIAFTCCKKLTSVLIPEGVTSIGQEAFSYSGLTAISFPKSLRVLGESVCDSCLGLTTVIIQEGVTNISEGAFSFCESLTQIEIPDSVTTIGPVAISDCTSLTEITIPKGVAEIGAYAFGWCSKLNSIRFEGDAPAINNSSFGSVTATVYYPADNSTWSADIMQDYGGTLTWVPYGTVENRILLDSTEFSDLDTVWIDGVEMAIQKDGDSWYIDLPNGNARVMTTYEYITDGTSEDGVAEHVRYPVSMQVWTLENRDGVYTATRQTEFDDILRYSGVAIRVTGKQGIRMITSIEETDKDALTGAGLAGYTLVEYGTAIAWADQISTTSPLTLGRSYVSSNFAYSKAEGKDPIFAYKNNCIQYTNVLVGFDLDQCADDLAMRPYMILADADGNEITIYGGIVNRSIGYIALRNRLAFSNETDAYDFIWDIIHAVYGDAYDADWKPSWTDSIL